MIILAIFQLGKVELMTKPAFILEVICSLPLIITVSPVSRLLYLMLPG